LPEWLLRTGAGMTLFLELVVPFFFFLPRRWRLAGATLTILWQVLIIATSNHNFFNLLTIALCLFLLDDRAVAGLLPVRLAERWRQRALGTGQRPLAVLGARLAAVLVVPVSLVLAAEMVTGKPLPAMAQRLVETVRPLRIVNRYHVFPTVDTTRVELEIEATLDGATWRAYRFRYKPGDPAQAPPFVVPHQPRIDWMMWFVPKNPVFLGWFDRLLDGLLRAEPALLSQLAEAPFSGKRPRAVRVMVYRYRYTDGDARRATGAWWTREPLGPFYPLPLRRGVGDDGVR
jgi:hypothetical protein